MWMRRQSMETDEGAHTSFSQVTLTWTPSAGCELLFWTSHLLTLSALAARSSQFSAYFTSCWAKWCRTQTLWILELCMWLCLHAHCPAAQAESESHVTLPSYSFPQAESDSHVTLPLYSFPSCTGWVRFTCHSASILQAESESHVTLPSYLSPSWTGWVWYSLPSCTGWGWVTCHSAFILVALMHRLSLIHMSLPSYSYPTAQADSESPHWSAPSLPHPNLCFCLLVHTMLIFHLSSKHHQRNNSSLMRNAELSALPCHRLYMCTPK